MNSVSEKPSNQDSYAIASLIFGILSIVSCCGGIIFGPLAIYFSTRDPEKGMSKAGKITGIIGLVLFMVVVLLGILTIFTGNWLKNPTPVTENLSELLINNNSAAISYSSNIWIKGKLEDGADIIRIKAEDERSKIILVRAALDKDITQDEMIAAAKSQYEVTSLEKKVEEEILNKFKILTVSINAKDNSKYTVSHMFIKDYDGFYKVEFSCPKELYPKYKEQAFKVMGTFHIIKPSQIAGNNDDEKENLYQDKDFGVEFTYPAKWMKPVKSSDAIMIRSNNEQESINLVVSQLNIINCPFEVYKRLSIEDIVKNLKVNKEDISVEDSLLGGQKGFRTKYSRPDKIEIYQDCTLKNNTEYVLTYSSIPSKYNEVTAKKTFESFKFIN